MPTTRDTATSKFAKIVKALIEAGEKVQIVIPGIGTTLAVLERLDDDVLTVQPDDHPRMIMHVNNIMVQRD